jgi:hypothetical protein
MSGLIAAAVMPTIRPSPGALMIGDYTLDWVRIVLTRQWIEDHILDEVLRHFPPSLHPVHPQPTPDSRLSFP